MKKNIFLILILCGIIGLNFKLNFEVSAAPDSSEGKKTGHCYTGDEKYKSEWSDEQNSGSYHLDQSNVDAGYTIAAVWIKASTECFQYMSGVSASSCYSVSWNDDQTSVKVNENFVEDDSSGCHDISHFEIQLSDLNPVPTSTSTPTPTPTPEDDPSPTPEDPSPTPTPTPEISQTITPTSTPVPTNTPTPTPQSEDLTPVPTPEPTDEPEDEDEETDSESQDEDNNNNDDDNNEEDNSESATQEDEETEIPQRSQILGASTDGYAATGVATDIVMSFAGISGVGLTGLGLTLDKKFKK